MSQPRIVVLASGEGTTTEALSQRLPIKLVISNNPKAGVLQRMSKQGVSCRLARNDQELEELLDKAAPDLIVLLGYMKKIPAHLVQKYTGRMLNTHPGLLPATKGLYGLNVQKHVLKQKLPEAGQSLHVVTENYDEGPVIAEHKIAVNSDDTPESLFARAQTVEKQYLADDIRAFLESHRG